MIEFMNVGSAVTLAAEIALMPGNAWYKTRVVTHGEYADTHKSPVHVVYAAAMHQVPPLNLLEIYPMSMCLP